MRKFLTEIWNNIKDIIIASIWNTIKDIIITSFSMVVLGITIVVVCVGSLFVTLYWPFYSYDHLNSFVSETQKTYPTEFRFASGSKEKIEQENSILLIGKFYCGAKLINQHIVLQSFTRNSTKADKEQETLETMYQNADKYLCPSATQVAFSR